MTDLTTIMHAIHAIDTIRERTLSELDAVKAILIRELPPNDPGPGVGVPHTREARRAYYKKHGVGASSHGRRVPRVRSNTMETQR